MQQCLSTYNLIKFVFLSIPIISQVSIDTQLPRIFNSKIILFSFNDLNNNIAPASPILFQLKSEK